MRSDRVARRTTRAALAVVAVIAGYVSYQHMFAVAIVHGEGVWSPSLLPLSVDGLIVATGGTLVTCAFTGRGRDPLVVTLLLLGCTASVAANVMHGMAAGLVGAVIAAWPPVALIGTYEAFIRQFRSDHQERASARPAHPAESSPASDQGPVAEAAGELVGMSKAAAVREALRVLDTSDVPSAMAWLSDRGMSVDRSYVYAVAGGRAGTHRRSARQEPTDPTPEPALPTTPPRAGAASPSSPAATEAA